MKTALITGASSGIGKATARKLSALGYSLALVARTPEPLQELAAELDAQALPADVSDPDSIAAAITSAAELFGQIDVLVNNAGYAPLLPTAEISIDQWQKILATNLSSVFYATRAVWPIMQRQNGGVIVNISSMSSKDPFMGLGAYGAAKAGVNLLTLATAREGAPHHIRVHAIAPGAVDTPMFRGLMGETPIDTATILTPEVVADAVAALLDSPLRYTAGETIFLKAGPA
jgi:3-oxoacyl-[acyl-carrier protein] reductase